MDACLATALAGTSKVKILFLSWPNIYFFLGANVYNNENHNTGRVNLRGERGSFNLFLSNCDYILMWVLQIGQHLHIINIGISSTPPPPFSLPLWRTHTHLAGGGGGLLDSFNGLYEEVLSVFFLLLQASGIWKGWISRTEVYSCERLGTSVSKILKNIKIKK